MVEPVILKHEQIVVRPYELMDIDAHFEAAVESIDAVFPWLPWCHPGYIREESRTWVETRTRE